MLAAILRIRTDWLQKPRDPYPRHSEAVPSQHRWRTAGHFRGGRSLRRRQRRGRLVARRRVG